MSEPFQRSIRPDAWIDWTHLEQDRDERHRPLLRVRQSDNVIHLTARTANELITELSAWITELRAQRENTT